MSHAIKTHDTRSHKSNLELKKKEGKKKERRWETWNDRSLWDRFSQVNLLKMYPASWNNNKTTWTSLG